MFNKLFVDHPRSVGETYLEHMAVALSFASAFFVAAFAATLHAVVPGLCQKVGSRTVLTLHHRMTGGQGRGAAMEGEYSI